MLQSKDKVKILQYPGGKVLRGSFTVLQERVERQMGPITGDVPKGFCLGEVKQISLASVGTGDSGELKQNGFR